MNIFKKFFRLVCRKRIAKDKNKVVARAQTLFQVREYKGTMWFTYDDNLVCPCSYFKDEATVVLSLMRKYFIERTPKLGYDKY